MENFTYNTKFELPDLLLHELFIEKTKAYPDKTALICDGQSLTYAELNNLSNKLANKLIELGVTPHDIVGVGLTPTLQQIVAVFGVLKTGAGYLPMDPSFPDERLQYILKDSGAKFLIAHENVIERLNIVTSIEDIAFDSFDIIDKYSELLQIDSKVNQDSIAYIIYTSGSTGNPKGVLIHHRAAVNFILSMAKVPGISDKDKLLSVTTISFDISILEIFLPLSFGATLILTNENDRNNSNALCTLIKNFGITVLQGTPSTWNILLSSGWKGSLNLKALCGGEAMSPNLAKSLIPKVSELWNMYGPTETTVWSTCKQITNPEPPILIGKPIGNTDIFILDKNNKKLPINVIGEISIGGMGVAKGYYKRNELTAEKFITIDGEIVYKTGDNGKIRLDGEIEILGRDDSQIKIAGYRIEPGEIEAKLCLLEGIKEAVVKSHMFDEMDERIIAFLHVTENNIDVNQIRFKLTKQLPSYMIPALFDIRQEFPRTPNGKIDRKKLVYNGERNNAYVNKEQINTIEEEILAMWQKQLKIKRINNRDDFYTLGGSSMLAINLINEVEKRFSCKISFRDFLAEYNSVQKMAEYITCLQEEPSYYKKANSTGKYKHMYSFSSEGTKPPVFAIYCDKIFSEKTKLKSEHPIYSFVWPGVDGKEFEFTTVEEVASAYMDQIMEVQPEGPYYLIGFSFGGYVAYEIAVMIQKMQGQKPVVVLLDTSHPQVKFETRDKFIRQKEINGYLYAVLDYHFLRGFRFFSEKYKNAVRHFKKKLNRKFTGDEINEIIYQYALKTGTVYRPEYFDGEIFQFKTYENPVRDPDLGWRKSVKKITTYPINGDHMDVLRDIENKMLITNKLYEYLNKQIN